jgi:NADH-quinone oxidoreductase subunit L
VPHWPELQRTLEHKFWFDELYDALFYRPASAIALWLRSDVETPYIEGSLVEIGRAGEEAGEGVARIQTGLLRTYALAITVTVVVLAVVFVSVR